MCLRALGVDWVVEALFGGGACLGVASGTFETAVSFTQDGTSTALGIKLAGAGFTTVLVSLNTLWAGPLKCGGHFWRSTRFRRILQVSHINDYKCGVSCLPTISVVTC